MTQDSGEIDPRNNVESQLAEDSASQTGSRSGGGAIFSGGRAADAVPGVPDPEEGDPTSGTDAGNPLDGVLIDPEDAAQAVPGDMGPEHPGQR